MSFDLTILSKKIEGLKEAYENGRYGDALVGALNTGNGLMQQRIFTETLDTKGQTLGQYVGVKRKVRLTTSTNKTDNKRLKRIAGQDLTAYQRKRAAKGRQIAKKDLEFTGGLRRAIETQIQNEKSATLQFNNDEAAIIAHGQEAQIARVNNRGVVKIFTLNDSEREQVVEQGKELIIQILKPK